MATDADALIGSRAKTRLRQAYVAAASFGKHGFQTRAPQNVAMSICGVVPGLSRVAFYPHRVFSLALLILLPFHRSSPTTNSFPRRIQCCAFVERAGRRESNEMDKLTSWAVGQKLSRK